MRTVYIECKMGIAGDMLSSALIDLCDDKEEVVRELNDLGIPKVKFKIDNAEKCGITGSHISVDVDGEEEQSIDIPTAVFSETSAGNIKTQSIISHDHKELNHKENDHEVNDHEENECQEIADHIHDHAKESEEEHHHTADHDREDTSHHHHGHHDHYGHSITDINEIITRLNISEELKNDIRGVYDLLAKAESAVHGEDVSEIHFHEVGNLDAVADITATCYLMSKLGADRVIVSPINVGSGQVKCAHGILPVPTPATALLLTNIPSYSSERIRGELCTPTGAALAKYFATSFGPQPIMSIEKIGYGMGKKDFDQANCVRVMLGETDDMDDTDDTGKNKDSIIELNCNIDDMTAEEIGFATKAILDAGAVDVFTIAAVMKKNRPATLLTVLCKEDKKDTVIRSIFANTTTIGIREKICDRYILDRDIRKIDTPYGEVRVKVSEGYGIKRVKPEYDDVSVIAEKTGKSVMDLNREIKKLI